jgi:hypothetical protein
LSAKTLSFGDLTPKSTLAGSDVNHGLRDNIELAGVLACGVLCSAVLDQGQGEVQEEVAVIHSLKILVASTRTTKPDMQRREVATRYPYTSSVALHPRRRTAKKPFQASTAVSAV